MEEFVQWIGQYAWIIPVVLVAIYYNYYNLNIAGIYISCYVYSEPIYIEGSIHSQNIYHVNLPSEKHNGNNRTWTVREVKRW